LWLLDCSFYSNTSEVLCLSIALCLLSSNSHHAVIMFIMSVCSAIIFQYSMLESLGTHNLFLKSISIILLLQYLKFNHKLKCFPELRMAHDWVEQNKVAIDLTPLLFSIVLTFMTSFNLTYIINVITLSNCDRRAMKYLHMIMQYHFKFQSIGLYRYPIKENRNYYVWFKYLTI
jgi:hypothetical protein